MLSLIIKLHIAIKNRADFLDDKKKYIAHTYWPLKEISMEYENWNSYINKVKQTDSKKEDRVNLIFANFYNFNNEIYKNTNLVGLKKFSKVFDGKAKIILDGRNINFIKFNKNHILLGKFLYKLLFSNIERSNKKIKIIFYYFQVILSLIILIFLKPKSITVGHLHKYWQIILASKILNIKTYHFMHGVIAYTSSDTTKELIAKNKYSIADVNLFPTKISLFQFKSMQSEESSNNVYLDISKSVTLKKEKFQKRFITIIGTWFLTDKENIKYIELIKKIIAQLRINYINHEIYYLPHIMSNKNIIFKSIPSIKEFKKRSEIIYSDRTLSFFSTLSIELYEKYAIPPILVPFFLAEEEYLDRICNKMTDAKILKIQ